jgi:hypothetical protein
MSNRKMKFVKELTKNSKLKLRKFIKTELGLSPNVRIKTLIEKTNVTTESQLYKLIKQKYNNHVEHYNAIIESKKREIRSLKSYETKIKKIIDQSPEEFSFKNINQNRLKIIVKLLNNSKSKYIIKADKKIYTLTTGFIENLLNYNITTIGHGSDAQIIEHINDYSELKIKKINKTEKHNQASFFKYEHKLDGLDLSELQIFQDFRPEYYTENCFIRSLINQVSDNVINDCKMMIKGRHTSLKSIHEIADKHDLTIHVKIDDTHTRHIGTGSVKVNICLLDEHYFKLCTIPVTKYAIKNYFDIKNEKDWNKIYICEKGIFKRKKRFIDSYNVVKLLLENKDTLLNEISKNDDLYNSCYFDDITKIGSLEYNDSNLKLNEYNPKDDKDIKNIFFDFETKTRGEKHIPYLCCIKSNKLKKTFYGEECGLEMLKYLHNKFKNSEIRLVAHNITYDLKFIFDHLYRANFIQRGNQIMSGSGFFWNYGSKVKIHFQDSYTLITDKLCNFGKMFKLEQEKEFIPYDLYNYDYDRCVSFDIIRKHTDYQVNCNNIGKNITNEDYDKFYLKFIENAKKWGCITNDKVDIIEYSNIYCQMDCEILEQGYNTFKKMINQVCELNIDNFVSIASVADTFMLKEGVYDGVYKLSGVVREFIQLCVVGGRTMVSENTKNHVTGKKLDDFDAVSLYPSAMSRLEGYLKGKPKVLETTDYNIIKNYDGYFVEVIIKSIGINRKMPLLSYINDDGVRNFTNDMVGTTVYLDKISLEDAIQFQDIQFEIIRGYYYNEGRNTQLKTTIDYMFNERARLKKEKNPLQNVFKLLMNSGYGKTILKPIDTEIKYYDKESAFNAAIYANYTFVKEAFSIGKKFCIKFVKPIVNHYNNASCGVEVLSMSKRIMNEVICTAEDKKIEIYYQDTDSMHIQSESVEKLSKFYYEKYNKKLIGKGMGQFHVDFSSEIVGKMTDDEIMNDEDLKKLDGGTVRVLNEKTGYKEYNKKYYSKSVYKKIEKKTAIYAKESIFLGKKCYLDVLTDRTGKNLIDYHIRMKGICNQSVLYHAKKDFNGDIVKLYKHLYDKKAYEFDLTCSSQKACFDMIDMATIKTKEIFKRKVQF